MGSLIGYFLGYTLGILFGLVMVALVESPLSNSLGIFHFLALGNSFVTCVVSVVEFLFDSIGRLVIGTWKLFLIGSPLVPQLGLLLSIYPRNIIRPMCGSIFHINWRGPCIFACKLSYKINCLLTLLFI